MHNPNIFALFYQSFDLISCNLQYFFARCMVYVYFVATTYLYGNDCVLDRFNK